MVRVCCFLFVPKKTLDLTNEVRPLICTLCIGMYR